MFSWKRILTAMRDALYAVLVACAVVIAVLVSGVLINLLWPEFQVPAWLQAENHETWLLAIFWWLSLSIVLILTGCIWYYDRSLPLDRQRDTGWYICPALLVLFVVPVAREVPLWLIAVWIYGIIVVLFYDLETTRDKVQDFLQPKQPTLA